MQIVAFDTETTGLDVFKGAKPFMFIFCDLEAITMQHLKEFSNLLEIAEIEAQSVSSSWLVKDLNNAKEFAKYRELVNVAIKYINDICWFTYEAKEAKDILEDTSVTKVMHNGKFDYLMSKAAGINIAGEVYDTMIESHLIDENSSNKLDFVAEKYLHVKKYEVLEKWFTANGYTKDNRDYTKVPKPIIEPYGIIDVILTSLVHKFYKPYITKLRLNEINDIERSLIPVWASMETRGFLVDIDYLTEASELFSVELSQIEKEVHNLSGYRFNISSPTQLAEVLILNGIDLPTTAKGKSSTAIDALEMLRSDPLIAKVLEHRKLSKLLGTYINNLILSSVDSVIHCNMHATGARTGRISVTKPALQTLPKKDKRIRRAFLCKDEYVNVFFDFKQMEYRIFADYSGDEELIRRINEEDADMHDAIKDIFNAYVREKGISLDISRKAARGSVGLTELDRPAAKNINFGVIYGMGIKALAAQLGVLHAVAKKLKQIYYKAVPSVKPLETKITKAIYKRGYIFNKYGRRRRLSGSESYKGLNSLCQGTSADMVKAKMSELFYGLLSTTKSGIILQVHDELVIEIHYSELHLIVKIMDILSNFSNKFTVKFSVDAEYTISSWVDKRKFIDELEIEQYIIEEYFRHLYLELVPYLNSNNEEVDELDYV